MCKHVCAMYVQVVNNLNKTSPDLPSFNASKLFKLEYYLSNEEVCITMSKQWLERLIIDFGSMAVESDARRAELELSCLRF